MEVNNEAETMIKGNHHEARAIRKRQQRLNDKWVPTACRTATYSSFWMHAMLLGALQPLTSSTIQSTLVGVTQCTLSGSILRTRTFTCNVLYIVQNVLEQSIVQCSVYVKIELPCQDCTRTLFISITSSQSLWDFIFSLLFETYINFPSAYLLPFGSLTALETLIKWRSLLIVHLVEWYNKIILFFVLTCAM